jgi:hypothetical protein
VTPEVEVHELDSPNRVPARRLGDREPPAITAEEPEREHVTVWLRDEVAELARHHRRQLRRWARRGDPLDDQPAGEVVQLVDRADPLPGGLFGDDTLRDILFGFRATPAATTT